MDVVTEPSASAVHESMHCVALHMLGRQIVEYVSIAPNLESDAHTTVSERLSDGEVRDLIVALLVPTDSANRGDRARAAALVRRLTRSESSASGLLRRSREKASAIRKDPKFRAQVQAVASVLDREISLTGFKVEQILAGEYVERWPWQEATA